MVKFAESGHVGWSNPYVANMLMDVVKSYALKGNSNKACNWSKICNLASSALLTRQERDRVSKICSELVL